ncbi:uracil phosphoribosyltransferase [Candidatus Roizmanbacteria bacterium RIFCSPLOWO2_01_FULL_38_12]|uniref:Uracil phosphoribosyltransferase n=1 Tax=Candidatus Roizmanbacteria bacterium RIFCSPLOWO2_01_FULL_38_12 TaxID=1802061 RepID=A0A1F7IQZ2_9BACT|nr:MAG: uracil phosphoribosyltransferase [Candidatus Roizmanbacteria bacterium RIFCSPHIGHO2_01_FULL_38_15]OGK35985.1 MAG: uracil phosphoribosyltransferase [Candidatus Roizmanbacteria bacterium RIFCSPHIGHO2_12_FULL_38_13]OGK45778.1 MAG: uracil phosphoribosyltransferase [Candidatus Roizmanbacteria bacterium RIFCSPLOWO2_01_FULL_38_12]
MSNLKIVNHPLILDSLTHLRNRSTSLEKFRQHSDKICKLMLIESMQDFELVNLEIETPIGKARGVKLNDEVVFIPVLRAGVAMLFEAIKLLPNAKVGFVGLERDENTAVASQYYWKLPPITQDSTIIVIDPMLATGGSLVHLLRQILPKKPKQIIIVSVIAAPEGVALIEKEFPNVKIYTAALDKGLDDKKFIVPGLGDYGDRYFGT